MHVFDNGDLVDTLESVENGHFRVFHYVWVGGRKANLVHLVQLLGKTERFPKRSS